MPFPFDSFDLPFMQRALATTVVMAVCGGVLGTWVVLREMAFTAHTLSSSTLPALISAVALGFSPALFALLSSLTVGLILVSHQRSTSNRQERDVFAGLLLAGTLALGVLLASNVFPEHSNFEGVLLGSLLSIKPLDVLLCTSVTGVVLLITLRYHRPWLAATFTQSSTQKYKGEHLLLLCLAFSITSFLPVGGSLLAATLLVLPAATARLMTTESIQRLYLTSVACGIFSGVCGLILSYQFDLPPGAAISVCASTLFFFAACYRKFEPHRKALPAQARS